jgi:hypothetical protein
MTSSFSYAIRHFGVSLLYYVAHADISVGWYFIDNLSGPVTGSNLGSVTGLNPGYIYIRVYPGFKWLLWCGLTLTYY